MAASLRVTFGAGEVPVGQAAASALGRTTGESASRASRRLRIDAHAAAALESTASTSAAPKATPYQPQPLDGSQATPDGWKLLPAVADGAIRWSPSSVVHGDAVLVEPRTGAEITVRRNRAVLDALNHLEHEWTVHVFTLDANMTADLETPLPPPLRNALRRGRLLLRELPRGVARNYWRTNVKKRPCAGCRGWLRGKLWYNHWLASASFWRHFTAPLLLLFELDTLWCERPTLHLSAFYAPLLSLRFLMVGAPWEWSGKCTMPKHGPKMRDCVGNSGLSLWRRDAVLALTEHLNRSETAQDEFLLDFSLSRSLQWAGAATASAELAAHFSVETISLPGVTPLGLHPRPGSKLRAGLRERCLSASERRETGSPDIP